MDGPAARVRITPAAAGRVAMAGVGINDARSQ
jgi:hypothetical protein